MRDPWPESVRRMLEACRTRPARDVLLSSAWTELREHCGELAVKLDTLGHRTIAQRVDRDYARLHGQLRETTTTNLIQRDRLLLADAIEELATTLATIKRFQATIVAVRAVPVKQPQVGHTTEPAADGEHDFHAADPEPDPLDTRKAVWMGKHIYLGNQTIVSRLFWLLAKPLGVARSLGEVQRAVDGVETDRDGDPYEVKKTSQRVRKAFTELRKALREAKLDDHVVIVKGGTRETPEYSMVRRYTG